MKIYKSASLIKNALVSGVCIVIILGSLNIRAVDVSAAENDFGKLSITFDDCLESTYSLALPVLEERNLKATSFVTTSFVGKDGYMTWNEISSLQNTYGWEIGSHTVNHLELPLLTSKEITKEVNNSYTKLVNKGLKVSSFASPFGAYDNNVLSQVLKKYNLHRGFWDRDDLNIYPYNRSVIMVKPNSTVLEMQGWVNQAISEDKWLVLVFHELVEVDDPEDEYDITVSDFMLIADYIKNSGISNILMNDSLNKPGVNLFLNNTFTNGISEGWTTDNASKVLLNTGNNGSFPSAKESIIFKGSAKESHLFSNTINANPNSDYIFECFVNTDNLVLGSLEFYIDEYDSEGNWISGQWLGEVEADRVTYFSTSYHSSSILVDNFVMQTYISANALGKVFVDNYEMYNLTPDVSDGNLVRNNSFEELNEKFATNWSTDSENFSIDTNSMGNDGLNSLHLQANPDSAHVFSSSIDVVYGNNYLWKQDVKATVGAGEFGFYIDEYDSEGNWISGQWLGMIEANWDGNLSFFYTSTSDLVKKINLQYYATAQSDFDLYLDSVFFGE